MEVHEPGELPAAQAAGARLVGWNARDLADFSVRAAPAALLRTAFPEALLIRELGIRTAADAEAALGEGFDALLHRRGAHARPRPGRLPGPDPQAGAKP